jgi:hypothetical protein
MQYSPSCSAMYVDKSWMGRKSQLPRKTWFNATWLPLQRQVLLTAYKVQACTVWRYDIQHEPQVVLHLHCVHQEHPSDWIIVMWLCQHSQACMCICTSPDRPFLIFVVTRVHMRKVFYYGLFQYPHSLQYEHSGFWLILHNISSVASWQGNSSHKACSV